MAIKRCPFCKKSYEDVFVLGTHIETKHGSNIPSNWSGVKYNFFSNHGRTHGTCLICKGKTEFDEKTGKPRRLCEKMSCHKTYREQFRQNMIKKHGKDCLLKDPEVQKKMLMNRSIAKDYRWSDGTIKRCIGSYEYDALRFLDIFLNLNSADVYVPAPQIIEYEYAGETHFYIPDIYISSLNLIIEIKDGGDNPNTHPKIQSVDKEKEKQKDLALESQTKYNYVKITNKQYGVLMDALIELKNKEVIGNENEKFMPVIIVRETMDLIADNLLDNYDEDELEENNLDVVIYHDKVTPIFTELGLLVKDKIYYYVEPNVLTTDIDTVAIEKRYPVNLPHEYRECIIKHADDTFNMTPNDNDLTMLNFPFVFMYDIISYSKLDNLDRSLCYNVYNTNDVKTHEYLDDEEEEDDEVIITESSILNEEVEAIDNVQLDYKIHELFDKFSDIMNPMSYLERMIASRIRNCNSRIDFLVFTYYAVRIVEPRKKELLNEIIKLLDVYSATNSKDKGYITAADVYDYIEIIKSNDYANYISKLSNIEKHIMFHVNEKLDMYKPNDIDYNHIMAVRHLLEPYKDNTSLIESVDMEPSIELKLDEDGKSLISKHDDADLIAIYNNAHIKLEEYEENNNIEGMKYELCKIYMIRVIIDKKYIDGLPSIYNSTERDVMVKCKCSIMSDLYKYLNIISKYDPSFDFKEYYRETQFGIETYKIDNKVIKGLKHLTLF